MEGGPRKISPFFIPAAIVNLAAGQVSMRFGAKGPNEATATACTTSAHSIGDSFRIIQHNDADVMIAGGSEAAITAMASADSPPCARFPRAMTIRKKPAVPGIRIAMDSSWAKAPGFSCSKNSNTRRTAAQPFSPKSLAMACPATPTT